MTPSPRTDLEAGRLVVKIGGSLWRSPLLAGWLEALRRFPHPLTIVPGGGPFADAVRAAQPRMGFSDNVAHKMALLAMEQYALALADRNDGLALAATLEEARAAHERGSIALWRPFAMVGAAKDIPASWDMTSDSLAAWYAHEAGASALLLIKSVDVESGAGLASLRVVDPLFARYVGRLPVFVAGPSALAAAAPVFEKGGVAGTRMDLSPSRQEIAS